MKKFAARWIMIVLALIVTLQTNARQHYFITDVMLIGGSQSETEALIDRYCSDGWWFIPENLNEGAGGDYIYLLYKAENNPDNKNHGFITDLYLLNQSASKAPATLSFNNRTYHLAPCDGSQHFKDQKGCLNSNASAFSDPIHLYYTKDLYPNNRAITEIEIDDNINNAVGKNAGTTGYDLNTGCGKNAAKLYLHFSCGRTAAPGDFISELKLIGAETWPELNNLKERYVQSGWKVVDYDLNNGLAGGSADVVCLMYRTEHSDGTNNGFITDIYITDSPLASITDRFWDSDMKSAYYLVPYDGNARFIERKGCLNSGNNNNVHPLHMYYSKKRWKEGYTVNGITFNDKSSGAVIKGWNGDACNLNEGVGGSAIYMHLDYGITGVEDYGVATGTPDDPILINDEVDWHKIAEKINNGQALTQSYVLEGNLYVTEMWGTSNHPFSGTFDGNGHRLWVNINCSEEGAAPFNCIDGATIKNLTVRGSVTCDRYHAGGLVGLCKGYSENIIDVCSVSTNVTCCSYPGGIVGDGQSSKVTVRNSVYSGTISGFDNFAGGIVGWGDSIILNMENNLFKGKFEPKATGVFHPVACFDSPATAIVSSADVYYLKDYQGTASEYNTISTVGIPVSAKVTSEWNRPVLAADDRYYYVTSSSALKWTPYSYGFEAPLNNDNWKTYGNGGEIISGHSSPEGTKCFRFRESNSNQYLVSPLLCDTSSLVCVVYAECESPTAAICVGYSNTGDNPQDVVMWNIYTLQSGSWFPLYDIFPADAKYIIYCCPQANTGSVYLDKIMIGGSAALAPRDLNASAITANSEKLSWTGGFDKYLVRYRKAPVFFEDFEDRGSMYFFDYEDEHSRNTVWSVRDLQLLSKGDWSLYMKSLSKRCTAYSGTHVLMGRSYDPDLCSYFNVDNWYMSPEVTLDGILEFWVMDDGNNHEYYEVLISTDENPYIFDYAMVAQGQYPSSSYKWKRVTVDLTGYKGAKGHFAIRLKDNGKNFLAIDDIGIYPEDWHTEVVSDSSMTLNDLDPSTAYVYEIDVPIREYSNYELTTASRFTTREPGFVLSVETATGNTADDVWYDMFGRKLYAMPVSGGIYYHNGQKVLVR